MWYLECHCKANFDGSAQNVRFVLSETLVLEDYDRAKRLFEAKLFELKNTRETEISGEELVWRERYPFSKTG
jgi:hypothetical protein